MRRVGRGDPGVNLRGAAGTSSSAPPGCESQRSTAPPRRLCGPGGGERRSRREPACRRQRRGEGGGADGRAVRGHDPRRPGPCEGTGGERAGLVTGQCPFSDSSPRRVSGGRRPGHLSLMTDEGATPPDPRVGSEAFCDSLKPSLWALSAEEILAEFCLPRFGVTTL